MSAKFSRRCLAKLRDALAGPGFVCKLFHFYMVLQIGFAFDNRGKSHHCKVMPTVTQRRPTVVEDYDVAADAKKSISLRNAKTKYFHVQALSNGCFYLEPRVLVSPQAISARSLRMLDKSVANLKKGLASAPIKKCGNGILGASPPPEVRRARA